MAQLRVVIIADGDLTIDTLTSAMAVPPSAARFVIAADGGALRAEAMGVRPDLVVGDGDSLGPGHVDRLRALGIPVDIAPADKDESDTELCLRAAVERGPTQIRIVGALGGPRVEHAVANLLLLGHPMLDGLDVAIVAGPSVVRRIGTDAGPGDLEIHGAPRDHVSLLAIGGTVDGVTTQGMRYPLQAEPLPVGPARGLSNELLSTVGRVTTARGRLLVIHTVRIADPS